MQLKKKFGLRQVQVLNLIRVYGVYARGIADILEIPKDEAMECLHEIKALFQQESMKVIMEVVDEFDLWQFKGLTRENKITLNDLVVFDQIQGNREMIYLTGDKGEHLRSNEIMWSQVLLAKFLAKRCLAQINIKHDVHHCRISLNALCLNADVQLKLLEYEDLKMKFA